jgi:hypothetical protein
MSTPATRMTAVMPSMMLPFTLKVPMVQTRITAAAMLTRSGPFEIFEALKAQRSATSV